MKEEKRFCPYCGEEINSNINFCVQCGGKLTQGKAVQDDNAIIVEFYPQKKKRNFIMPGIIVVLLVAGVSLGGILLRENVMEQSSSFTASEAKDTDIEEMTESESNKEENIKQKVEEENIEQSMEEDTEQDVSGLVHTVEEEISFENFYEDGKEYAVITRISGNGERLWSVKTDRYGAAQLNICVPIGSYQNGYYYVENGTVVKLDIETGEKIWRCNQVNVGSPAESATAFGEDGTLYISGYLQPEFVAINRDGKLVYKIDAFSEDSQYFWPYKMEYKQSYIDIYFEGNSEDEAKDTIVRVDLPNYAYYKLNI